MVHVLSSFTEACSGKVTTLHKVREEKRISETGDCLFTNSPAYISNVHRCVVHML